ncbi:MAG: LysR family transcriptional regulator [Burkholderiales bacterium]|nr:LysR family transcriptional regulator [Burkholderiales bacterium]
MNVTLRQLRLFVTVADELNFTAAASRSSITQSALTAAIRSLEQALGLRLFDRSTRKVRLTEEGVTLLAVAKRLLEDFDTSLTGVLSMVERLRGHVSLSLTPPFLAYVGTPALIRLSRTHPGVTVRLADYPEERAVPAVLAGALDFAVCGIVDRHPDIASIVVARDAFGVVSRVASRDSSSRPIRWDSLDASHYVTLSSSGAIRRQLDRYRPEGVDLSRSRYEVASVHALRMLVLEGVGFGIIPAMTAATMQSDYDLDFRLLQPALFRELHMIKRRGRLLSPAASALVREFIPGLAALNALKGVEIPATPEEVQRFILA